MDWIRWNRVITLQDIEQTTADEGERWGYTHVRRVLALAQQIDTGLAYDAEAFAYAVYLHDWGAFPRWRQAGVDHALRSCQVAEQEILPFTTLHSTQVTGVLEAIERHDFRDMRPVSCTLALLLREADWLDMLGAIGMARELAWGPNDLPAVIERIKMRRSVIPPRLTLAAAQALAVPRTAEMDHWLAQIEAEGLGWL
jgi:uncharacterized protein